MKDLRNKTVTTRMGVATYSVTSEAYDDRVTYFVKIDGWRSENEFSVPFEFSDNHDTIVRLYLQGFEQGRHSGMWEKAEQVRELFNKFKSTIGA